ncbi:hypothetical protein ANN_26618 [Periplaneta americana]|uniref:Uncharacterized protein n=1 Tax=Periplaneta americana TaxID=6978 RepID=A0ABQ8RYL8_PERAM|nr:hypothetical protein ANN_26618 [Periplaneta americana]
MEESAAERTGTASDLISELLQSSNYIKVNDIRASEKINTFASAHFSQFRHTSPQVPSFGHGSLYDVMWLADEPREFNLPTLPQRRITYVPEKLPSKYGVHSEEYVPIRTYLLTLTSTVNMETKHLICVVECCRTQPMITNTLSTTWPSKTQFERGYGSTQTVQTAIRCYDVQVIPSLSLQKMFKMSITQTHLLLEYRFHIDVSLTCEHDPKRQEYCNAFGNKLPHLNAIDMARDRTRNLVHRRPTLYQLANQTDYLPVSIETFEKYTNDTGHLYVQLYPWYYMPSSLHKILIHGGKISETAILPIGMLSEDAQETRHKDLRKSIDIKVQENQNYKLRKIKLLQVPAASANNSTAQLQPQDEDDSSASGSDTSGDTTDASDF